MKQTFAAAFVSFAFLLSSAAFAGPGHGHPTPQYGGVVTELKELQYEIVAKPDSIALYIDDHGKKIDTKGASAKVILLNGRVKTAATLAPAGENKLEAKGAFKVEKGTKIVAVVSLREKSAQSVRFALK